MSLTSLELAIKANQGGDPTKDDNERNGDLKDADEFFNDHFDHADAMDIEGGTTTDTKDPLAKVPPSTHARKPAPTKTTGDGLKEAPPPVTPDKATKAKPGDFKDPPAPVDEEHNNLRDRLQAISARLRITAPNGAPVVSTPARATATASISTGWTEVASKLPKPDAMYTAVRLATRPSD
eukprot:scaffold113955_cov28-Attheya_sp.AAC.3